MGRGLFSEVQNTAISQPPRGNQAKQANSRAGSRVRSARPPEESGAPAQPARPPRPPERIGARGRGLATHSGRIHDSTGQRAVHSGPFFSEKEAFTPGANQRSRSPSGLRIHRSETRGRGAGTSEAQEAESFWSRTTPCSKPTARQGQADGHGSSGRGLHTGLWERHQPATWGPPRPLDPRTLALHTQFDCLRF
ncbi:uncharacterized protein LOC115297920 isoform X2 [Suricata suricatta]|uniref:uncharacterized protein LOC115297920 isoform X2 n=1 Tax=Suricata suricatta TaxID=37032 RepID=UPI00115538D2|nr:uncharacterized protein LOC115297920 isoform X2 [Suricata suricatta]